MNYLLFILLVLCAAFSRIAPHPPNFTPILSIALFCGISFKNKYIFLVPILAMLISDIIIGYHSVVLFVYISLLFIFLIGRYSSSSKSFYSILLLSLSSVIIFFIISNFGVWLIGYPKTVYGLVICYVSALPFLTNSLISTFIFSSIFYYCYMGSAKEDKIIHTN